MDVITLAAAPRKTIFPIPVTKDLSELVPLHFLIRRLFGFSITKLKLNHLGQKAICSKDTVASQRIQGNVENILSSRKEWAGTSLVVRWLRLHASNAEGLGSVPG